MELFRLLGTIIIENAAANKEIDETTEKAEKSQDKIGTAFEKIGTFAAKCGKAVATGMAAGSTAIVAMAKEAVGSYAEYEQLVGGVETLFKESANSVLKYAQNAYKTAGLSANEYMETVTSFSASLLQSLGGDTAAAVEYADLAITDMSDNANKMGTSMTMIQNAYQGFAKQNYTMLDNLKLGYGGTQEEMKRLLKDAEKLAGKKFDLSSYADVVEAIHVIQTEMGITGTTAEEASETIQGSVSAMKSAWQNLLTGMADENQNLEELLGQFLDSVVTVGNNVIPRIQKLLPRLVSTVSQMVQQLAANLPQIIQSLLPTVLEGAINITTELVRNIPALVKSVMTALAASLNKGYNTDIKPIFEMLGSIITEILVPALELVMTWIGIMVEFAREHFGFLQEVVEAAIGIISEIIQAFTAATEGDWEGFWDSIVKIVEGIGSALYAAGKGIFQLLWEGMQAVWSSVTSWVEDKVDWIVEKFEMVKDVLSSIKDAVAEAVTAAADMAAASAATQETKNTSGSAKSSGSKTTSKTAKHADGGILTKPTIFGYTPSTDTYHLGGEAGAEAVAPIDVLQGYVRTAVAAEMSGGMQIMIELLRQLVEKDTAVYLNSKEISKAVNKDLGVVF